MTAVRTAETITALDVFLNSAKVGTIVRTPGDFNAFSLDPAYRATGGIPVLSLSLRAASGACAGSATCRRQPAALLCQPAARRPAARGDGKTPCG